MIKQFWSSIEADFLRCYRIDLSKEYKYLSWRKFRNLLGNLPSDSTFYYQIHEHNKKSGNDPNITYLEDPIQIAAHMRRNKK